MRQTQQIDFFPKAYKNEVHEYFDSSDAWWDRFGESIRQHAVDAGDTIRTLSLFSGAGGLDIGFHDAGFEIVEAVELDPKLAASLQSNVGEGRYFGEKTNVVVGDICEYDPILTDIDFIIGGPPCQTFSAAGARASGVAGRKDARGNLFQEYVRILKKLKPKGFLFENVYRILGANQGKDWQAIILAFSEAGYDLKFRVLDTADFGVPQNRERLIVVGVKRGMEIVDYRFPQPTHGIDSPSNRLPSNAYQALRGINSLPEKSCLNGRFGGLLNEIPPGLNYSFFTEKMGHPNPIFAWRSKFSDFLYKADPEEPVRTIKAQGGQYTGPFHWDSRPFSKDEYKRLQTFPDRYEMTGSKGTVVKQIGNSVPPQFARILALSIREQVFGKTIPLELPTINDELTLSFRKQKSQRTKKYRQKAREAIELLSNQEPKTGDALPAKFNLNIADNFAVKLDKSGGLEARIDQYVDLLKIAIAIRGHKTSEACVDISPVQKWALPHKRIKLYFDDNCQKTFTAAWKVLELYLSKNGYKADLEQLNGYYQYKPRINCVLECEKKNIFGTIDSELLNSIISGELAQRKINIVDIALERELDEKVIYNQFKILKSIGYAIRNSKTNIAMAQNEFLIPYAFPTLSPLSVQLNKAI